MHGANIFRGIAYATEGCFAHPFAIANALCDEAVPMGLEDARRWLERRRMLLQHESEQRPVTQAVARAWAILRDVDQIAARLHQLTEADLEPSAAADGLDILLDHLRASGFRLETGALHLVDDFPGPYAGQQSWALSCDVSDRRAYGVEVGIYVRRSLLMPLYTPFLVAHELVHQIAGQIDGDYLARGLEDGLGDVYGSLHLASRILPVQLCEAMLRGSRLIFPLDQYWRIYVDAMQQALLLHDLVGLDGLEALMMRANREGRRAVKAAEEQLLAGRFDALRDPAARLDPQLVRFGWSVRAHAPNLVVSPLAFFVAHHLEVGARRSELVAALDIEPQAAVAAFEELQQRVFVAFLDGDEVSADEASMLLACRALRYELT